MLHPNDPSESISRGNRSNHESLWLWDAKFVKALHSRSTRLETVPFNARRYSRETPSPIVLAEKEEEEEESIRGEKRRGDQQGETKEWRTAVDELCRASEPTAFFFLLSPSILSTNPPTHQPKASLSAATQASFRRLITYARPELMKVQGGDGPNPLLVPLSKIRNK